MKLLKYLRDAVLFVKTVWTLATVELLKAREEQIKEHGE